MIRGRRNKASGCRYAPLVSKNWVAKKKVRTNSYARPSQSVSRVIHTYMYRIVRFGDYLLNAAAAVAANNTSSATAGQQHTAIILWSTTLRQQLYSKATQSTCLYDAEQTRGRGRENIFCDGSKKSNRRLSLLVLFFYKKVGQHLL